MYPWLFIWAPQFHFPWSGAVTQDISPDTFFNAIPAQAGDGEIEKEIFRRVSYGRQLGALTDTVLMLLDKPDNRPETLQEQEAAEALKNAAGEVKAAKAEHRQRRINNALATLRELKRQDPEQLKRIVTELQS